MELDYGKMTAGERAAVINLFEAAIASNSQSTIGPVFSLRRPSRGGRAGDGCAASG
jgi:hypothetical protein